MNQVAVVENVPVAHKPVILQNMCICIYLTRNLQVLPLWGIIVVNKTLLRRLFMTGLSPMMQQYFQIKDQYKDAILFFRMGDFYEMFFEDAIIASKDMEITLTGRDCGLEERAPMCGVPHHAVDTYVAKLIEKGHKVAICEQTQDPAEAKGLVERQVIRVITPGTIMESSMLEEKTNNYLISLFKDNNALGFSGCLLYTSDAADE